MTIKTERGIRAQLLPRNRVIHDELAMYHQELMEDAEELAAFFHDSLNHEPALNVIIFPQDQIHRDPLIRRMRRPAARS